MKTVLDLHCGHRESVTFFLCYDNSTTSQEEQPERVVDYEKSKISMLLMSWYLEYIPQISKLSLPDRAVLFHTVEDCHILSSH